MTREEAIKVLSSYDVNGVWTDVDGKPYNAEEQAEALEMAIEALKQVTGKLNNPDDSLLTANPEDCKEQKSKLNLISRAEAIEALGEEPPVWCDEEYEIAERNQWREDVEAIESVPSADRPRGEWIESREQNILMAKRIEKGETWRVCSNCGTGFMIGAQLEEKKCYGERFHNFCPRCGADMRGGERSE